MNYQHEVDRLSGEFGTKRRRKLDPYRDHIWGLLCAGGNATIITAWLREAPRNIDVTVNTVRGYIKYLKDTAKRLQSQEATQAQQQVPQAVAQQPSTVAQQHADVPTRPATVPGQATLQEQANVSREQETHVASDYDKTVETRNVRSDRVDFNK